MFNASSSTNNSSAIPLDLGLGSNKKDLFNSSTSDFFDPPPPPPPGGPGGGGRSPLFDRPLYQLVPYQVIDLSFLRKLEVFNSILNAFGDLFSSKTQITQTKDLLGSKTPFPLHSKYDFSKLNAFDPSTIPPIILQCYGICPSSLERRRDEAYVAAHNGQVDILRSLATVEGLNLNDPTNRGSTPASIAAEWGRLEVLRFLATVEGVNLNQPDMYGKTPVSIAAEKGYTDVLRFLATVEGVNFNQTGKHGASPAYIAAKNGHLEVLKFLATVEGVNIHQPVNNRSPADAAAGQGHSEVSFFLQQDLVRITAQSGDVPRLRQLLLTMRGGFNAPDSVGVTPAHLAAARGDIGVLRFLVTKGINLNKKDDQGQTLAHYAVRQGNTVIIKFLARLEGIKLNQEDDRGQTLAHQAAAAGHIDIIKFLATLEGVNLNQADDKGHTPAYYAAAKKHMPIVSFLEMQPESKPGISLGDNKGEVSVPPPSASAPLRVESEDEGFPPEYEA